MDISITEMIFTFLGGLGIFLYGLKQMGTGLQEAAGDRLRDILNKFTSNPVLGVLAGMLVTILIQSSSGTTVITIGLVSAGFMTLKQAIGVIMGANIGTTVTAFIIGIDLGEYALPIIALGSFIIFFINKRKVKNIGIILFGFGSLFFGLELMSGAVKPLADLEGFKQLMLDMSSNPVYGVLAGTFLTALVQSSSATIGILQEFYANDLVPLHGALPVLLGDNVGTTITAVLASLAGSLAAKRTALVHVMFNVIGVAIFMLIFPLYEMVIEALQRLLSLNPEMVIAFAHGTFNFTNTLIQLPFVAVLAWIVTRVIPGEDIVEKYKPQHLNKNIVKRMPSIAIYETQEELQNLGRIVTTMLVDLKRTDKNIEKELEQKYQAIATIHDSIHQYLVKISQKKLSMTDSERISILHDMNRSVLKVGNMAARYVELRQEQKRDNIVIPEGPRAELHQLYEHVLLSFKKSIKLMDLYHHTDMEEIVARSEKAYKLEHQLRKANLDRLNSGEMTLEASLIYMEKIAVLERVGYHARNISEALSSMDTQKSVPSISTVVSAE